MLSESFLSKLNNKLDVPKVTVTLVESNINQFLITNLAPNQYQNEQEFIDNLSEGISIKIGRMASECFAIPGGEYIVYKLDQNNATLFPVNIIEDTNELFDANKFTIPLTKLKTQWNNVTRVLISEEDEDETDSKKAEVEKHSSKYPRDYTVKGAIEASGKSQDEIAGTCNVDPSTVSRWTAKSGDGSRKPSLDHAMCIANQTGQDVESLFHDKKENKKKKANSSSGGGRNELYKKGNKT